MTHYLIEFRFHGKAKYEIKRLINGIVYKFRLPRRRAVPHITLVGPFFTRNQSKLVHDFYELCSKFSIMSFEIDGFDYFDENRVIFIDIKPSQKLDEFRWELSKTLQPYCNLNNYDYERNFEYHATIAMKLDHSKFSNIKNHTKNISHPRYKHFMIRATLLKGSRILYEYDFLQRRMLGRWEAKSKIGYIKTIHLLKKFFEGNFNPDVNTPSHLEKFEQYTNKPKGMQKLQSEIIVTRKTFFQWIKNKFDKPRTFFTSDLHLDHENIIRFCNRPFKNVRRMNTVLVNNWNRTIDKKDTVYFLGDMSFGKGSRSADYWLSKLNGNIFFIRGFSYKPSGERNQHDRISRTKNVSDNLVIEYKNRKFFLVHDPDQVPSDWKDWAICGHHHNNKLEEFPFINKATKRINVSVELTKYRPVDIDELIKKIEG